MCVCAKELWRYSIDGSSPEPVIIRVGVRVRVRMSTVRCCVLLVVAGEYLTLVECASFALDMLHGVAFLHEHVSDAHAVCMVGGDVYVAKLCCYV